jgi:putative flippase GtrA
MLLVAFGLLWVLPEIGVPQWLAVVVAILVAVSLEPSSYVRRGSAG